MAEKDTRPIRWRSNVADCSSVGDPFSDRPSDRYAIIAKIMTSSAIKKQMFWTLDSRKLIAATSSLNLAMSALRAFPL